MSRLTTIFLCIQAFMLQNALTAPTCLQLGNGLSVPNNLQLSGRNYGNQQGLPSNVMIEPCNQVMTELSSLQCGDVSVTGDLPIGGSIRVSGCIPIYGVVAVDGTVPSQGTAVVNHSCGPC